MQFPTRRMRRLRKTPQIRKILRETTLNAEDFIYPLFIKEELEEGAGEHIDTLPGQYRYSLEDAVEEAKRLEVRRMAYSGRVTSRSGARRSCPTTT